jgi:hypothetical protein
MSDFNNSKFNGNVGFGSEAKPVLFNNVEYSLESIYNMINDIDNLDEQKMKNIILRQYDMILNYDIFLSSDKSRQLAQKLFTNKKFLSLFNDMIGLLDLTTNQIICINKLTYDYYTTENNNKEIADLFMNISSQVNNNLTMKLSTIIGINGGRILSMISRSSFKVEKNVHRVNSFLLRCDVNLSVQNIIDIYCKLYANGITFPFIYSMLESKYKIKEERYIIFDRISLAWLEILDSLTFTELCCIIAQYGAFLKYSIKQNTNIRFSLKTVSNIRILKAVEAIENDKEDRYNIP